MTDVFLGYDTLLSRRVAIKRLFPEFATDPKFVERFRREATAAANLNHPNIVAVYDWGSDGGTYYIVMEYIEGHSLAELLRSGGPLAPERAAAIAMDIADALGFAHAKGVIHRDVKPSNVLLSPNGQVKVTDFGIAITAFGGAESNLTQTGTVMGTATYFSPEQAEGRTLDHRSDLYSLGIVLYEMLCGRPPFTGDFSLSVAYKHVQQAVPSPSSLGIELPESLVAITMKLLVKNPAERYPTTGDLKKDLQRYREGGHQLSAGYRPAEAQPVVPPPTQKAPEEPPQPKPQAAPPAQGVGPPPPVTVLEPSSRVGLYTAAAVIFVAVVLLVVFVLVTVLGNGGNDGNGSVSVSTGEPEEPDDPDELPPDGDTGGGSGPVPNGESVPTGVLVAVPGVVDQSVDDAVRFLRDRGFASELRVESGSVGPAGQVLRQDPSAGSEVASGSLVVLYLAEGPRAVEVPDVVGMTLLRATQVLVQAGLVVSEEVVEEFSVDVERGLVIGTVPAPPALLPPDSSIIILVSSGSENVVVPNLVGLTSVVAAQRLSEIQLVLVQPVGECDFPNSTEDLAGRIMDQTPSAGEEHSQGTEVTACLGQAVSVPDGSGSLPPEVHSAAAEITQRAIAAGREPGALGSIANWNALSGRFESECRNLVATYSDLAGLVVEWNLENPYPMPAAEANSINWVEGLDGDTPGVDDGCVATRGP